MDLAIQGIEANLVAQPSDIGAKGATGQSPLTLVTGGNRQQKTPSGWDGVGKRVKGVEPYTNMRISGENDAIAPAKGGKTGSKASNLDAELRRLADAWPTLPADAKAMILKLAGLA